MLSIITILCRSTTVLLPQIKNEMIHRRLIQLLGMIENMSQLLWQWIQKIK